MAKTQENSDESSNLLARMLEQASDLEFTDPLAEDQEKELAQNPRRLIVEGFEYVYMTNIVDGLTDLLLL